MKTSQSTQRSVSWDSLARHTQLCRVIDRYTRLMSIHQRPNLDQSPPIYFPLLYWKVMAPHFPTVLLQEHIRSFLVSVILGRIRSIWVVEVFVLKKKSCCRKIAAHISTFWHQGALITQLKKAYLEILFPLFIFWQGRHKGALITQSLHKRLYCHGAARRTHTHTARSEQYFEFISI